MSKPQIELIRCNSGDWEVLKIDSEIFAENHKLSSYDWVRFLDKLGYKIEEIEISDEDMEMGNY